MTHFKSKVSITNFFSSKVFLTFLGCCLVASSIYLWKSQESKNLSQSYLQTESKAVADASEAEIRYRGIYNALKRLANQEAPNEVQELEEWGEDAAFLIDSFEGIKNIAWVDKDYFIRGIAPRQGNESYLNQKANEIIPELSDMSLMVPMYQGAELEGFILGTISMDLFMAPVINSIQNDYMLELSNEGKPVFTSENWKMPTPRFVVDRTITLQDTAVLNLRIAPTDEYLNLEIADARTTLILGLLFSFITIVAVHFAQNYNALSKLNVKRYRDLLEDVQLVAITLDFNGHVTFCNDYLLALTGWKREEVLGKDWFARFVPSDWEKVKELYLAAFSDGTIPRHYENPILTRSGEQRFLVFNNTALWNTRGECIGIASIGEDITERKKAQAEQERLLQQVQFQFQQMTQIVESVPQGMLLLDVDGRVLLANPTASRDLAVLTEARAGDILTHLGDQPLANLLMPPHNGSWREMQVGSRIFEIVVRAVAHDTGSEQWVLLINEVTQARQMQMQVQQQERLATVGQMAAGMAHDFNNIMGIIVLYAQLLGQSPKLLDRDREWLTTITEQAERASDLIRQILDFSRRSMLERQPLDLLSLVKEQVQLLKRTLPESIVVQLDYSQGIYKVHADPTRMQQMMMNLVINAGHAMPDGGSLDIGLDRITVTQGATPLPLMEAGEYVQVTVADTGTGISPKVLPHIFDPFYTTKAPGEGTGLGLAQVHGIVGQHEGHIDVRSQVGVGTTFTIYLPALAIQTPVFSPEKSVNPEGNGEMLLVVEDNPELRSALVTTLDALNYRMLEAANGLEALAVLTTHGDEVALVLSDVVMPEMGGIALFHALKEKGWTQPMILLTGHAMKDEMKSLREQGLRAWLLKPPDLGQLTQAIARALKASLPV